MTQKKAPQQQRAEEHKALPEPPAPPTTSETQKQSPQQQQAEERKAPPAPPTPPAPPPPTRPALVPGNIPYITTADRARIRDEYMLAPDFKALATSVEKIAFVTGQPSQEAADHAAMEACAKLDTPCELYASGNFVVTLRRAPQVPPASAMWLACQFWLGSFFT